MDYEFPGNIRELENIIERAFILCEGREISIPDLPPQVIAIPRQADRGNVRKEQGLDDLELEAIRAALERHSGNRTRAAKDLGIHRTTMIRKLKRYCF